MFNKNLLFNIGHRGAAGHLPENTLASIRKAVELNADMIEIDVYYIDKKLVLIHDDRVDRTTDADGYVWNFSFDELRKLDAGNGEKIPTLQEAVEIIPQHIQINIEIKGRSTTRPVIEFINQHAKTPEDKNRFLVSSFIHRELKLLKKLDKDIRIGALCCAEPVKLAKFAEKLKAYSVNPSLDFVSEEFVKDAHMRGLKVFVYTVNHPDDMQRMHEMGVDGIFSNYPERTKNYNDSISVWL